MSFNNRPELPPRPIEGARYYRQQALELPRTVEPRTGDSADMADAIREQLGKR